MKKHTLIFIGLIIFAIILSFPSLAPESFNWKVKLGFIGKISLIVGIIGLWLFTILPALKNKLK